MARMDIMGYVVDADAQCWIVARKKVKESGKNEGEEYLSDYRFYPNLSSALVGLQDRFLRESEVEGLTEVLEELKLFRSEVDDLLGERYEHP